MRWIGNSIQGRNSKNQPKRTKQKPRTNLKEPNKNQPTSAKQENHWTGNSPHDRLASDLVLAGWFLEFPPAPAADMNEDGQQKPYDLGERTLLFAKIGRA